MLSRSLHLLPHLFLLSTYYFLLRASCYACSYLVSASWHERFSHASYLAIHVYFTCMACILLPLPYMLPYCTCTLLIPCFVAPCILYMILVTLCSVPVQRTSRQSELCRYVCKQTSFAILQRLPNIRCLSCLLCTCSTSSRTGYESESPTNSGVIEDTGDSMHDGYCVRYEEGRGGIQKCCVCWKGQKT